AGELAPAASTAPPVVRIERRDMAWCIWSGNAKRGDVMVLLPVIGSKQPERGCSAGVIIPDRGETQSSRPSRSARATRRPTPHPQDGARRRLLHCLRNGA